MLFYDTGTFVAEDGRERTKPLRLRKDIGVAHAGSNQADQNFIRARRAEL